MATAYFYSTAKRHNSTLVPTGGTSVTLTLKGGSDLIDPVFLYNGSAVPTSSMIYFEGRYYFVTGIKSVRNDLWEISGHVDVLATWKTNIQAMSPYVLYYTHSNSQITDHRLSAKTTQVTQSANASFTSFGVGFTNVLSVIGKDHVAQFKLNFSDIKAIISQTFFDSLDNEMNNVTPIDTSSVENAISDAGRFLVELLETAALAATYTGKLSDCIRNCYILPIDPAAWGGSLERVYIGKCDTGVDGYELASTDRILHDSATVQIPWQASDWRRNAPYHEIYLYLPCIGLTVISPSDVIGETYLHIDLTLDKISGDVIINVGTTSNVLAQYTTNVAVNYPVGSSKVNPANAITSIGGAAGAIAAGINPAVAAAVAGLGIANAIQPQSMSIGSNGGGAFLGLAGFQGKKVYCFTVFHDTTVTPSSVSAEKGTPYNGVLSLASVTGYVQTMGASVSGAMTDTERQEINSLMDGGIYIE